jgi:uncharacterized membrane protein
MRNLWKILIILYLARVLHVIGVVIWIGGVAFVTTVLIPALRKMTDTHNRLELFEQLEGKFGFQAKIATLITGVSGVLHAGCYECLGSLSASAILVDALDDLYMDSFYCCTVCA